MRPRECHHDKRLGTGRETQRTRKAKKASAGVRGVTKKCLAKKSVFWLLAAAVIGSPFRLGHSPETYPIFHLIAELFSIIVGASVFLMAWNARKHLNNNYLLFLGIALLFIAALDLVHALAYRGVAVLAGPSGDSLPSSR